MDDNMNKRLEELKLAVSGESFGETSTDVNNHIHTTYSFSPYTPSMAVLNAKRAGLATAGIMDHDSVAGLREFSLAGRIAGLPTTGGAEVRASFLNTPFADRRINHTDQNGSAYIALHGIADSSIDEVEAFLAPLRKRRNARNREMVKKINAKMSPMGIEIDFEKDVMPLSECTHGGSITERHLIYALARKMLAKFGIGEPLIRFLREELKLEVSPKIAGYLSDSGNKCIDFDLLGVIKSDLTSFYIPATDECADVREIIALAERTGAISAYAYLGDVVVSATGDKRSQHFEDAYLDELFAYIKELGFRAVTYMPPRNTPEQLKRVRDLCDKFGFMQISGVDINTPRQEFICKELRNPEFGNLVDSAWALIGHERMIEEKGVEYGIFGAAAIEECPELDARIKAYSLIGKKIK